MKIEFLDCILVPIGIVLLLGYHVCLLYRIINNPKQTVIGINTINRRIWVQTMMQDTSKNGVLAVQTLRNNIMASTLLASTAIMLTSIIAVLMTSSKNGNQPTTPLLYGDKSQLGFSIKFFCILLCFLLAFLFNVQSIRYYSHASILINVPINKISSSGIGIGIGTGSPHLTADYVSRAVNRGSYFWSLGLRSFYFSFPLFLWIFGPIPMFLCCLILVSMLYFLDVTFCDVGSAVGIDNQNPRDEEQASF
ncbi:hypothetical protein FRX31_006679 [Thalictrum thalictroides]|uniref:Transmembrane protein n=1 Tax=Thalictrum thalictroides TaxID=46969 RepID=A0A7J6X237_THATH|nr:hypothetical protein FRX31_006679 [Thalictrum thalictroides]